MVAFDRQQCRRVSSRPILNGKELERYVIQMYVLIISDTYAAYVLVGVSTNEHLFCLKEVSGRMIRYMMAEGESERESEGESEFMTTVPCFYCLLEKLK